MTTTMPEPPGAPPVARPPVLAPILAALAAIPAPPLEIFLELFDDIRSWVLRAVAPRFRSLVVERDVRVAAAGIFFMCTAVLASSTITLWLLVLGPLLWGVPHVVSDVRYLVARPGFHRRPWVLLAIGAGMAAGVFGFGVRGALGGAILALCISRASFPRKVLGGAILSAVLAIAQWSGGRTADMVFAHGHNLVGVLLWFAWRPRQRSLHWLVLILFLTGVGLILSGALDPLMSAANALSSPSTGLSPRRLLRGLCPDPYSETAGRYLALYAFGQGIHYVMWLRLIPEDARPSATPRSWIQTYRALRVDVGSVILWVNLLIGAALVVYATMRGLGRARDEYIRLVAFHGYLELAAAAVLWGEGAFSLQRRTQVTSLPAPVAPPC